MQFIADVQMQTSVVAVAMTMENNGEQLVYSGRSSQENLLMDWIWGARERKQEVIPLGHYVGSNKYPSVLQRRMEVLVSTRDEA